MFNVRNKIKIRKSCIRAKKRTLGKSNLTIFRSLQSIWLLFLIGLDTQTIMLPKKGVLYLCVSNMLLVVSITFYFHYNIWGCMCSTDPFQYVGDWKDISIAHVIIIIKSEVSTFPVVIIFFRACMPEMFATSYSVTYCIYIPEKNPEICFHYCAVYDECK